MKVPRELTCSTWRCIAGFTVGVLALVALCGCAIYRIWVAPPDAESLPYADDEDIRRHRVMPDNREFHDDYD